MYVWIHLLSEISNFRSTVKFRFFLHIVAMELLVCVGNARPTSKSAYSSDKLNSQLGTPVCLHIASTWPPALQWKSASKPSPEAKTPIWNGLPELKWPSPEAKTPIWNGLPELNHRLWPSWLYMTWRVDGSAVLIIWARHESIVYQSWLKIVWRIAEG